MKILMVHNFYQQPGGEDSVFASECALLESRGHQVEKFILDNDAIEGMGKLTLAGKTIWNRDSARKIREIVETSHPQVVHFHNTFPLVSPAAYWAARGAGAAVVQTLHNFRTLCNNALLFRKGHACESCVGKSFAWPGVLHKCYRGSFSASLGVAATAAAHRLLGTWKNAVDVYIALSEFSRTKFVAGGMPTEKIVVKPNFLDPDPGIGAGMGGYAIFVGRLSPEKGVETLLDAWKKLEGDFALKIVGDGPLAPLVQNAVASDSRIQWLGRQPIERVCELVGDASLMIVPSNVYENFPRTIVEAFAKGTPVLASNHGPLAEIVETHLTGALFKPGSADDLTRRAGELFNDPRHLHAMRDHARAKFESHYTGEKNLHMLLDIYERAIVQHRGTLSIAPVYQPAT